MARAAIMKNQIGRGTGSQEHSENQVSTLSFMALQRHGLHTFSGKESQGTRTKRHI